MDIDPFHRGGFGFLQGALRAAVPTHFKAIATPSGGKSARSSVGQTCPPGVLRRFPDARHRAAPARTNKFNP